MSMSELFRHYAQQCIDLAEISGGDHRDLMLSMASKWRELADLEQREAESEANEKKVGHSQPPESLDRRQNLGPIGGVWQGGGFERVR